MQRCLYLAELGAGNTAPNPMVGAVLVHNDCIIGEGYHKKYGEAHAEVNCIASVLPQHQHLIEQATLYVSLEPCAHFGKTPPCADLIVNSNIPKVVIGCTDPYKEVAGRGIQKLKTAGIDVTVGVLEAACRRLNKRFFTFQQKGHPYVILKWAQSADGKITGPAFKRVAISNAYTNRLVHQWRSEEAAILVGTNTALFDNPELTTRLWPGNNPTRLVLDKHLRLPASLKLLDGTQQTIIFNQVMHHAHPNLLYYQLSKTGGLLQQVLEALHQMKLQSVLVEGGAQLLQSFFTEDLWDEAKVITNQQLVLRDGLNAPHLHNHHLHQVETVFSDTVHIYVNKANTFY